MAKQKFSEAEIIAALKRSEAGLTYEQLGRVQMFHALVAMFCSDLSDLEGRYVRVKQLKGHYLFRV